MGICRNTFGKLSYTAINKDKKVYSITKGENEIKYHRPYISGKAAIMIDSEMAFWTDTPHFESFIQGVAYLKKNLEYLL